MTDPSPHRVRAWRLLLLIAAAIAVVAATQQLESPLAESLDSFMKKNGKPLAVLAAALLALFAVGLSRVGPRVVRADAQPNSASTIVARGGSRRRILGAAFCAIGAALLAWVFHRVVKAPVGLAPVAGFIGGLGALVLGAALIEARRRRGWWRDSGITHGTASPWWRRDAPWLTIVLLLWFGANAQRLDTRPGFFHGDEAMIVAYGRQTYFLEPPRPDLSPWTTLFQPFLSGVPRALLLEMKPEHPYFGPRLYTLLLGTGSLALLFFLLRSNFGRVAAWSGLIICASSHTFMHFSRQALNNVDAAFLLSLWAVAWLGAWRSRRASLGLLAGVATGLSYYTYQGALVALPVMAFHVLVQVARAPSGLWRRWHVITAAVVGFAFAAGPFHVFYRNDPGGKDFRTGSVFLLNKQNLENHYRTTKSESVPQVLLRTAWPALGGSLLWRDTSSNYAYLKLPMLDRSMLALSLVGGVLAFAMWRRRHAGEVLLLWAGSTLVLGAWLTVNPGPPYAPRLIGAWPAFAALSGMAVAAVVRAAAGIGGRWGSCAAILLAGVFLFTAGHRQWRAYHHDYLNDLTNDYYRWVNTGFMEWLRTYPRDAYMVYYSPHPSQMYTSVHEMWDWGWPRTLLVSADEPIPPPSNDRPFTFYVFKLPEMRVADRRFAEQHPDVAPLEIRNLHVESPLVTHRVYRLTREGS